MATPNEIIDMMTRTTPMPLAIGPICCHISMKFIPSSEKACRLRLLQSEVDRDGHDDRHRHAVQQGRRKLPLFHRIERRLIQQRDRAEYLGFLDPAVGADGGLDDDDALDARRL